MVGLRILASISLISWFIVVVSSGSPTYNNYDDIIQDTMDSLVQDLTVKYSPDFDTNTFWHPYVYGTGNENREVIHVEEVKKQFIDGDYFQWKYARLGLKHYVVGLSNFSIALFGSDFTKITSIDTSDSLEALAVYTRWNDDHYVAELIILAVTSEPRLNVYLLKDDAIENVGTFPLHYAVKGIELCHVGSSTKVVIIPKEINVDIDIYNVEINNGSQVWFFQRLPEVGSPNVVIFDSDMLDSVIAVARDTKVEIYTFNSKAGLFHIYQTIVIQYPCRRLFSFTLAYQHHIGCIPEDKDSSILFVSYNYNTNEYLIEDNTFGNITAVEIYPVAVADYRDEYLLIVQDSEGLTKIMSYHGGQIGFQVEKTCDKQDKCPAIADLHRGIGFRQNDFTVYVFPSERGSKRSEVWLIKKQIRDSSSPLVAESRNLYNTFQELSKRFENWERGVIGVQKKLTNRIRLDQPNKITGSWDVESLSASGVEFKQSYGEEYISNDSKEVFHSFTFMDAPWTEKDFFMNQTKTTQDLNALQKNVALAKTQLSDAVFENSPKDQIVSAPQNISGTFDSKYISAGFLIAPTIQDYINATTYFNSLATKSLGLHIKSYLVFEGPLQVSNLNAGHVNEVNVSNIARLSHENIFNCSMQFIPKFTVGGSVSATTVNGVNVGRELVTPSDIADLRFMDGFVVKNNTKSAGQYNFHKVLLRSEDQLVSSHIVFGSLKTASPIMIDSINEYSFSDFVSSVISKDYSGVIYGTKTVSEVVEAGSLDITNLWNYMPFPNSFVHKTLKRVKVNGYKNFTNLEVGKLTVGMQVDGLDPSSFVELSSSLDLPSKWTFVGNVSIVNDISVSGTIDGVNMEDLKRRGTLDEYIESYEAVADVEFEQEIQIDNLFVESNINSNKFDESFGSLLLFNGSHCKIPGLVVIKSNLALDALNIDSNAINSFNLKTFFTISGDQNVTGNIKLMSECQFQSLFALEKYDNVDLQGLLHHAVRLTGTNKIPWKIHFDHIVCGSSTVVGDTINRVSGYGNSIGVISGREFQTFSSNLIFEDAIFQTLAVKDDLHLNNGIKLGGINVVAWNHSRMSLSKDEKVEFRFEVDGRVKASHDISTHYINDIPFTVLTDSTFRNDRKSQAFEEKVNLLNDLKIFNGVMEFEDKISDYSLDDLKKYAFPLNASKGVWLDVHGIWHFKSVLVSHNLTVQGTTCGVDLEILNSDSVRLNDSEITMSGTNTFSSITVKRKLQADLLNSQMNFDNLFNLHEAQSIMYPFHFLKDVIVDGNLITNGQLNNVSIASLVSSYSNNQNHVHTVHGDYHSNHGVETESLRVAGDIQGINFEQQISNLLRTTDPNLVFSGFKEFKIPVTIGNNADFSVYNDIVPADLSLLKLNDDITFDDTVAFNGPVKSKVIESYLDNIDPTVLVGIDWEDLIRHSIPVNQDSSSSLANTLNFNDVFVRGFINTKIFQNKSFGDFVTLNAGQKIDFLRVDEAKFNGPDVPVHGLVSGVDVLKEFEDTLMKNANPVSSVKGSKSFRGVVIVTGDFNCFGPELKKDVVDISKDFNISTPIEFEKQLYVDGGVNVTVPVHGHTIESIVSEALTQEDDQDITGEWEFAGGVTFKEDVEGTGELQNFDLQGLIDKKNKEIKEAEGRINKQKQVFQESCYNVYNLTEELTSNPMKLNSFDKHQTIVLRKQIEKATTMNAAGKFYLLTSSSTCEIIKYEWKSTTELFYREIDGEEDQLRLGHVMDWESVTHGNVGILVFSTETANCSSLAMGIHVLTLEPHDGFSKTSPLLLGDIKAFKLVSDPEEALTAVFVLKDNNCLQIFLWIEMQKKFSLENELILNESYNKIELTPFRNGVGVLLGSEKQVSIYHYSWITKSLALMGNDYFLTEKRSSSSLFESYGDLYAIVPQKMTQVSTLPALCTVQILKTSDKKLHRLQKLPVQDLMSHTVISFSSEIYVTFLSKSTGLSVYKYMGLNGLQLLNENPIKVFKGFHVDNFEVRPWHFSSSRPFILLLTSKTIEIFHSNVYGDSLTSSSRNLCRVG